MYIDMLVWGHESIPTQFYTFIPNWNKSNAYRAGSGTTKSFIPEVVASIMHTSFQAFYCSNPGSMSISKDQGGFPCDFGLFLRGQSSENQAVCRWHQYTNIHFGSAQCSFAQIRWYTWCISMYIISKHLHGAQCDVVSLPPCSQYANELICIITLGANEGLVG